MTTSTITPEEARALRTQLAQTREALAHVLSATTALAERFERLECRLAVVERERDALAERVARLEMQASRTQRLAEHLARRTLGPVVDEVTQPDLRLPDTP